MSSLGLASATFAIVLAVLIAAVMVADEVMRAARTVVKAIEEATR